jgi:protein gp37
VADKSKIEWTESTWNPIRGCSRVSEGCRNCYAESVAYRFSGPGQPYEGLVRIGADGNRKPEWNGQVHFVEEHLLDPLKWKKPRRIFVNSMSDLFHENIRDEWRDKIFAVMALASQHTFQVLTKRPERMRTYIESRMRADIFGRAWGVEEKLDKALRKSVHAAYHPLPNVWLGVSVEDQKTANARIPLLLQTPAAVRFISAEPLLGPIDWHLHIADGSIVNFLTGGRVAHVDAVDQSVKGERLDWVIVGGESGPKARLMHPDWARRLRNQCQAAGVAFFFKQWGEWIPWEPEQMPCWKSQHGKCEDQHALFPANIADDPPGWDSGLGYKGEAAFQWVGKKAAGHTLDGEVIQQYPAAT